MKISMQMNDIREALYGMHKITTAKAGTPYHTGSALIMAYGGTIDMWVTSLDTFIRAEMQGEIIEEGSCVIDEKQLYKTVKKLNKHGGELVIESEEDTKWLSFDTPQLSFRMADKAEYHGPFPELPPDSLDWFKIDGLNGDDLGLVANTASVDDSRENLTGVHFGHYNGVPTMVSTDGHRLTKVEMDADQIAFPDGQEGFTLFWEAAEVASYIMGRKKTVAEDIKISFTEVENAEGIKKRYMGLKFGRYEVYGREADDGSNFPDYTVILPSPYQGDEILMDRDTIHLKVDAVQLFASPKTNSMRVTVKPDDDELEFYASDPDYGEGDTSMKVEGAETPVKFAVNYKYFLEAVDAFDGDEIVIRPINTLSPIAIHAPGKPERMAVVMPLRL